MKLARRAPTVALLKVEEARALLATCKTVDEAKSIRDKAEAIRVYLRSQKASAEAQNDAAVVKLWAERRLGLLLDPGREKRGGSANAKGQHVRSLPDGVTHKQSERWQDVARVPEKKFEAHLATLRQAGERVTTAALTRELKRAQKLADIAERAQAMPKLGGLKPVPVLYADPPWRYEHAVAENRAIENQYPTMSLDEICAKAPPATPDAILFLWATSPKLAEAMRVIEGWGFTYRTSMVWVKDKIGMGYYARQRHELLLIATRGQPPAPAPEARPDSVIEAPRGEHSAKPAAFAEAIERMYPNLPKRELYLRGPPRRGWEPGWGNQAA